MSEQIRELFTSIAPTYDRLNHLLSFSADKRWRRATINSIDRQPDKPLVALDLCAGTLDLALEFLRRFRNAACHAVDFSQAMLNTGAKKIPEDMKHRLHLHCADALKLPFPDNHFDVVFCGYGFRNLDNPDKGMEEIRRVLKPGGKLLILDFFKPRHPLTKFFHSSYGRWVIPALGGLVSGKRGAYEYLRDSIQQFYSVDECKKMFEKRGFNRIEGKNFFMGVSSVVTGFKSS